MKQAMYGDDKSHVTETYVKMFTWNFISVTLNIVAKSVM